LNQGACRRAADEALVDGLKSNAPMPHDLIFSTNAERDGIKSGPRSIDRQSRSGGLSRVNAKERFLISAASPDNAYLSRQLETVRMDDAHSRIKFRDSAAMTIGNILADHEANAPWTHVVINESTQLDARPNTAESLEIRAVGFMPAQFNFDHGSRAQSLRRRRLMEIEQIHPYLGAIHRKNVLITECQRGNRDDPSVIVALIFRDESRSHTDTQIRHAKWNYVIHQCVETIV